jgi:hypothetical protein
VYVVFSVPRRAEEGGTNIDEGSVLGGDTLRDVGTACFETALRLPSLTPCHVPALRDHRERCTIAFLTESLVESDRDLIWQNDSPIPESTFPTILAGSFRGHA